MNFGHYFVGPKQKCSLDGKPVRNTIIVRPSSHLPHIWLYLYLSSDTDGGRGASSGAMFGRKETYLVNTFTNIDSTVLASLAGRQVEDPLMYVFTLLWQPRA
jgi:hypothetical protein